jgi:hypothetical protein
MNIAFFDILGEATVMELEMKNEGKNFMLAESYVSYSGRGFYKAVLPNFSDKTYIKVDLDEASLKFFKENVTRVKDHLAKAMIWYVFYEMV